jgi:UDP:flavonoid glycosyltransferase YjiC (YdhE family)
LKTFLLFPYANHLGGTQPLVTIGEHLRARGHRVIFAARGKCVPYIRAAGFAVEDVIELDPEWSVEHLNKSSLNYHTQRSIDTFVKQELSLIDRYRPAAVVDLHRPTLGIAARMSNTPRAVLCNTVLTRYYDGEKLLPESHPLAGAARFLPKSYLKSFSAWAEDRLFRYWGRPYNAYLKQHHVPHIASMKELFEGDATILMDAPEFAGTTELPAYVHAVGPILHERAESTPKWLEQIDPKRRTIMVYLGSYGEMFSRVVGYLSRMFAGSADYQVIAATGGLYDYSGPPCPSEVTICAYVPASAVLAHRGAAMITHGGRGSIYSALRQGVPIAGIPNQGEQEWNLDTVKRLGLGCKLSKKGIDYATFSHALREIIEQPAYRERARQFGKQLRTYQGGLAAASIIESLER